MIESTNWRKYEREIHKELSNIFKDCEFEFDDRIFGKFSKIDRQIDISIRGEIGGNKILGVIDCKFFSKNIDIKIIESFIGMLEDTKANFGIIITNKGFSESAKRRANIKNLKLDIISFNELNKIELTYDYFVNQRINNLELSRYEFLKRLKEISGYYDISKSNYGKRIATFKEGYTNSEYYAFKRIIKESARLFRDFNDLDKITIKIPVKTEESKFLYSANVERTSLENFLKLKFSSLKEDIKLWRSDFLDNKNYTKQSIYDFAEKHIKCKEYNDYKKDI